MWAPPATGGNDGTYVPPGRYTGGERKFKCDYGASACMVRAGGLSGLQVVAFSSKRPGSVRILSLARSVPPPICGPDSTLWDTICPMSVPAESSRVPQQAAAEPTPEPPAVTEPPAPVAPEAPADLRRCNGERGERRLVSVRLQV